MRVKAGVLVAALSLMAAAVPLLAHHSFAAEYDANKPVTVTGTVTKLEWMNPHARFYVDVKEVDGRITHWNFELGAIPVLVKQGWRRDSLKPGDEVTVEGSRAKDGSTTGNDEGRGLTGAIVVSGNVPSEARLDRPPQPQP